MTPSTKLAVGAQHCFAPRTETSTRVMFGAQTNVVILSEAIEDSGLAGRDLNVRTCEAL